MYITGLVIVQSVIILEQMHKVDNNNHHKNDAFSFTKELIFGIIIFFSKERNAVFLVYKINFCLFKYLYKLLSIILDSC